MVINFLIYSVLFFQTVIIISVFITLCILNYLHKRYNISHFFNIKSQYLHLIYNKWNLIEHKKGYHYFALSAI